MFSDETSRTSPGTLACNAVAPAEAAVDEAAVPSIPGCDVTEYDEGTGQKEWEDSVFVQDFTDSVLDTTPSPLQGNPCATCQTCKTS